ncbi:MAG: lycopene cyclase domain-containing protein [Actinomycetes bacterium]
MGEFSWVYLSLLLLSEAGVIGLDFRHKLALGYSLRAGILALVSGLAFFLLWDVAGINAGIFFEGAPQLLVGVELAPELPLEEIFFLLLLCHSSLLIFAAVSRWVSRRR